MSRLPFAPIERLARVTFDGPDPCHRGEDGVWNDARLSEILACNRNMIRPWRLRGLTFSTADRLASCLNYHPINIWGSDWELAAAAGHPLRPRALECKRGHPFTPENTYTAPSGRRQCKICRRARRPHEGKRTYACL